MAINSCSLNSSNMKQLKKGEEEEEEEVVEEEVEILKVIHRD